MRYETSLELAKLLSCPITRLPLQQIEGNSLASSLGHTYPWIGNTWNMIPRVLPPFLASKQGVWEKLQANGILSYTMAPQVNLSAHGSALAESLSLLLEDAGLTLDVGCGPQNTRPAYASRITQGNYVGLDPLAGDTPRTFPFIQGLGELLPFQEEIFDTVLFCSSLDHHLNHEIALKEALRVLRPNGRVVIAMDDVPDVTEPRETLARCLAMARRGLAQVFTLIPHIGLASALAYVRAMLALKIPSGAQDQFHLCFPSPAEIVRLMSQLNCQVIRTPGAQGMVFLQVDKLPQLPTETGYYQS